MKKLFLCILLCTVCVIACRSQNSVLPFKYYGHLYCPVVLNDSVKGNFVFDTGADYLYLDTLFLYRSPLPQKNTVNAYLPGVGAKPQKVKMIRDKYTCDYGPLALVPPYTVTIELRSMLGRYADGIVGMHLLKDSVFAVDYVKEEIRLLDPADFSTQGYEKIPITIRKNRIYVKAAVQVTPQKQIAGEFLLDMGNGGALDLTSACAREHDLARIIPEKIRTYTNWGGVGGASSSYVFRADTFCIGDRRIERPVISYSADTKGALSERDYIGLIGNGILNRFDLIVDIPGKCLWLRPNKNISRPYGITTTGFSFVDRTDLYDGWVVRALYEGLAAEKAGLQIGDLILRVNDRDTRDVSIEEQQTFFRDLDSPYILTIERNKQLLKLTLHKVE